jgi:hypothetical protein
VQINGTSIFNKQLSPLADLLNSSGQLTSLAGNSKAFSFSGKLVFHDQVSLSTAGLSKSEKTAVTSMNSSISRIAEILEQMKELSEMSEKDDISDETRLSLQITLTRSQANLHKEAYSMGLSLSGMTYTGQRESLGGTRAFSTLSIDEGLTFNYNGEGKNYVAYIIFHSQGTDIGPIYEKYADLNIGEIKVEPFYRAGEHIPPGQVAHVVTLIEGADPQTSKADELMERLLEAKESGTSLDELLADKSFTKGQQMELLTVDSAKRFTSRIDKEINKLNNLRKELSEVDFSKRDVNLSVTSSTSIIADSAKSGKVPVSEGKIVSNLGEMGFSGSDRNDVRLLAPLSQVAQIFQTMDDFFKDSVYKNLGMGNIWAAN